MKINMPQKGLWRSWLIKTQKKNHFRILSIFQHCKSPYIIIIILSWRFSLLYLSKIWMIICLSNNFQRLLGNSVEKRKRLCPTCDTFEMTNSEIFFFQIGRMIKQRRKFSNFGREIFSKNGHNIGSSLRNREISHVCLCHARTVHPYKWRTDPSFEKK